MGKNFRAQNPRVLFVGKTLRDGWDENEEEDDDAYIIKNKNGKPIFIDITKDFHEERSFKGYKHKEDILIKCFKKYKSKNAIDRFFKNKPYPNVVISDICEMLNNSEYKVNGKQFDEKTTKKFLEKLNAKGIKEYLFENDERIQRGSNHPLAQSIKYILEHVYGIDDIDELWKRVAITNVVKCTVSGDSDETPSDMIQDCIINAGFIKSEIEIIQPTHIVFFTAEGGYIDYIEKLEFENCKSEQIYEKCKRIGVHTRKIIGTKQQPAVMWWYKIFFNKNNKVKMHILVTRHPQGASNKWKEEIAEWIKYTHQNIHNKSDMDELKMKYQ